MFRSFDYMHLASTVNVNIVSLSQPLVIIVLIDKYHSKSVLIHPHPWPCECT